MNRKMIAMIGAAALLIAVIAAAALRLNQRGKDILGVTTLPGENQVIMNADTDHDFVSGEGNLTVGEGEHIHLDYNLKSGNFDVVFVAGMDEVYNVLAELNGQEPDSLPIPEDWQSFAEKMAETDDVQGQGGIEGRGSLDFEGEPGGYTVVFYPHEAVGRAVATSVKD